MNVRKSNNEICALFILTQHEFPVDRKKNELFLAKVKPIVSLERPKLTGSSKQDQTAEYLSIQQS